VHEILHVLLEDIFAAAPRRWWPRATREFQIDLYATRLWLFGDGAAVYQATRRYLERLRSEAARA
jgi:hypothetical protein